MPLQKIIDQQKKEINELTLLGIWNASKFKYHNASKINKIKRMQVNQGEVWYCDLGYNVGTEKNKSRPVLVISNNKINRSGKVVVLCLTKAQGKTNQQDLPDQDSWYLLYSNTNIESQKLRPNRPIIQGNIPYNFLDRDSLVQCEEVRSISKSRLDQGRRCIGRLTPKDISNIKKKFLRTYDF